MKETFREDLKSLINSYSIDNMCETPDFILADFLCAQITMFKVHVGERDKWFRKKTLSQKPSLDGELVEKGPANEQG